jgi:hypothetical protein
LFRPERALLIVRTLHLFFIKDVQTSLVWLAKIVTDPFHDIKLYYKAPLALLRGELIDPGTRSAGPADDPAASNSGKSGIAPTRHRPRRRHQRSQSEPRCYVALRSGLQETFSGPPRLHPRIRQAFRLDLGPRRLYSFKLRTGCGGIV